MTAQSELPDKARQLAVLSFALVRYPERFSADELRREMLADRQDFAGTDAHNRAVRDLLASGLLRRDGDSVIPSRAAVRFHDLHG
ncbi:MAG: hypothetical protein JWM93_322 [Frankiales bacterium]|nr:hypothetical protein [Frankiales bacterium]